MQALENIVSKEINEAGQVFTLRPQKASLQKEKPTESRADPRDDNRTEHEKITQVAEAMDNYLKSTQTNLQIQVFQKTGDVIVRVISEDDGKVIREIPPEEMLNLAAKMEEMVGTLFNESV
ncbi:MAG: flagellar protein FlaG [Desulfobacteraceae bacterium]|nr:MAG: flagellar protein FlaG [Desulfobacteraceae bacterium]